MPDTNRPPASQQLREVAVQKEGELEAMNAFQPESKEYSANVVPAEIDGAKEERIKLTVMNPFTEAEGYKNPDGVNI